MSCSEIRDMLPGYVDERTLSLDVRRHLARCPECKQELERYESLMSSLSALRTVTAEVPEDLARSLVEAPFKTSPVETFKTHVVRNRRAYVSGLAVIGAGATGAVLWRSRRRALATA